jgi:hypothetical protein
LWCSLCLSLLFGSRCAHRSAPPPPPPPPTPPPGVPPTPLSFPHPTFRAGLDFFSRCILPKTDDSEADNPHASHPNPSADVHGAGAGLSPASHGDEGLARFRSPLGRRMSTFALSTGLAKPESPKLGPKAAESPNVTPQIAPASAGVKVPALHENGPAAPAAAHVLQPYLAPQTALDVSFNISRRQQGSSIVLSPVASPQQPSRQRCLPSLRTHDSPDEWQDIQPARTAAQSQPSQRAATPGALQRSHGAAAFGSSGGTLAPAAHGHGAGSQGGAGSPEDEVKVQRRNRLLALASARRNEELRGVAMRSMR